MDRREAGRVAGAFVGALVLLLVVHFTAAVIFAPEFPERPGFAVALPGEAPKAATTPSAPAKVEPIGVRLGSADVERGRKVFAKCAACHTPEKNAGVKVGPNLWGVVGGPKAHMAGFRYSAGMAERGRAGETWSLEDLDRFLTDPKAFVPATAMGFPGIRDAADRADVIAYLRSLSDAPVPRP